MTLLAAVFAGVFGFLVVAQLLGVPLTVRRPRVRTPRDTIVERRRRWLRQAGASVTATQFYAGSVAAGVVAVAGLTAITGIVALSVVPGGIVALAPHVYWSLQRSRRLDELKRAWPDGLRDLAASLNADATLDKAIRDLADTGPDPVRRAIATYDTSTRLYGGAAALEHIRESVADPTTDRVIEVLAVALERGTRQLADTLRDLATSIERDTRTDVEIRSARREPLINMAAAAAIPWLLIIVSAAIPGSPIATFYTSRLAIVPIGVAAAMTAAGILWVLRLSRNPVEPRLFVKRDHDG